MIERRLRLQLRLHLQYVSAVVADQIAIAEAVSFDFSTFSSWPEQNKTKQCGVNFGKM